MEGRMEFLTMPKAQAQTETLPLSYCQQLAEDFAQQIESGNHNQLHLQLAEGLVDMIGKIDPRTPDAIRYLYGNVLYLFTMQKQGGEIEEG
jgi:hypothetical protein